MTRPSPEMIARVDALVAQLDAETFDQPIELPATSSYDVIVTAWERFKAFIEVIDCAVADPFANGAVDVLASVEGLVGRDTDKLVFWLTHVGAAIDRSSALPRPRS